MLQAGTHNTRNFAPPQAIGKAGRPMLLKRGMSGTIQERPMSAEYIARHGDLDICSGRPEASPSGRPTMPATAAWSPWPPGMRGPG